MSFLAPWSAVLVLVGIGIVVQYILKLRRPTRVMPSTFLWDRALSDTRANAPWQRLRFDSLLLLQLLALLVLVLALMRPYVLRASTIAGNAVVILDASVTSQTIDGGQQRFKAEVTRAQQMIGNLPPGNTMSIVRLDSHPRVLIAASGDHDALDSVVVGQQPGYDTPDTRTALSLAYSLANQVSTASARPDVIILRSAGTPLPGAVSSGLQDQVFGRRDAPNLGIAAIAASRAADGTTQLLVRIRNTGRTVLSSDIHITVDGRLQDVQSITVGAGDEAVLTSNGLPAAGRAFEAQLTAVDALAADSTGYAVLNADDRPHVLLVTPDNLFLQSVLSAVGAVTSILRPNAYRQDTATGYDFVIFDRYLPASMPDGNALLIDPVHDVFGLGVGTVRSAGTPTRDDDPAGLLRYMSPGNMHISRTRTLEPVPWMHVALRDGRGALLLEGIRPAAAGGRVALIGFDLHDTDLPLSQDFPVLMVNLLHWLAPGTSLGTNSVAPGTVLRLPVPSGTSGATLTTPNGSIIRLLNQKDSEAARTVAFASTEQPGIYTLVERVGGRRIQHAFAVNTVLVPATTAIAQQHRAPHATRNAAQAGKVPLEFTGMLAACALLVLLGEWFVAMRRR